MGKQNLIITTMKQYSPKTIAGTIIILAFLAGCKKDLPFGGNVTTAVKTSTGKNNGPADNSNDPISSAVVGETIFDHLNIVAPPANGTIYGFPENTNIPGQQLTYLKLGFIDNYGFGKPIILNNANALGSMQFVKAGVLPVSKKPYYYIKLSSFFLTMQIDGVYLLDEAHSPETCRRWLFEPAPATPGVKANNFYIYSMVFSGALMRLQVRWSDKVSAPNTILNPNVYLKNYLGFGTPNNLSTQVFSIRNL
jgi:hypothetical protein